MEPNKDKIMDRYRERRGTEDGRYTGGSDNRRN